MEKEAELRKINSEIEQLKMLEVNNKQLSEKFGSLTGVEDTSRQQRTRASFSEIQLTALYNKKDLLLQQYQLEIHTDKQIHDEQIKKFELQNEQLQKELEALVLEETELVRRAEIDGTIGNVNAQTGELLSPYTTILSIYESNPTVIKAVMNEGYKYAMEVGKVVKVESMNRSYSIEGKVTEIGARIIEYPSRLKSNQNIQMWGQELFIKIPKDNKFLNGERVIVIIKN
jgi:HlyD family secretion protein